MEKTRTRYKLIKRVKDEKFDIEKLGSYILSIQIGVRDLQLSVVDGQENRCLFLEDFVLAPIHSASELLEVLKDVWEEHHFLSAGYWKNIKVCVKNQKFSQVPASLFIPEAASDYLAVNCKFDPSEDKVMYYKSLKSEVITVFSFNKSIIEWINSHYPNLNVGYIHQSSALIEGVLQYSRSHKNITMYLYVDRFKLHLLTLKKNGLEYYNQFNIKNFDDYIKYIVLVIKGLRQEQKSSNVVMWGYIGKQSKHYNEFRKYIKSISFGDRPDYFKFGYDFDEIQDHHYFDLYSSFLCE